MFIRFNGIPDYWPKSIQFSNAGVLHHYWWAEYWSKSFSRILLSINKDSVKKIRVFNTRATTQYSISWRFRASSGSKSRSWQSFVFNIYESFFFFQIFSGILCRPVALSIPYLILLFYSPFVPVATSRTIRGHTGYFLKAVIAITSLIILSQIAFQIFLVSIEGTEYFKSCEFLEILFRHIGFIKLSDVTWVDAINQSIFWSKN